MWVCERHKNENNEALENFKDEYQKNHKLTLGLFTTPIQLPALAKTRNVTTPTKNNKKSSILEACEKEDKEVNAKPANTHKNITTNEGTRKLRKKLNSSLYTINNYK